MSRNCLYCGREIKGGHFCKSSGHHIIYKNMLVKEYREGTITEEHMEQLRYFNWVPGDVVAVKPAKKVRAKKVVGFDVPFRKFGVELECVIPQGNDPEIISSVNNMGYTMQHTGYTHRDFDYWKSLYDSSIRTSYNEESKEFVSPPMATADGFKEVADVCTAIKNHGGYTNTSTGTHIHLDASDLSPVEIAKVVYLYAKFETQINSLFDKSRSRNRYCQSVKRFIKYCSYSGLDYFDEMSKLSRVLGTRYVKVNVEAFMRHGTVEFRQHGGTLDGERIEKWVKLCTRMVAFVKAGNDVTTVRGNMFKLLGCSAEEIEYWTKVKEDVKAAV